MIVSHTARRNSDDTLTISAKILRRVRGADSLVRQAGVVWPRALR